MENYEAIIKAEQRLIDEFSKNILDLQEKLKKSRDRRDKAIVDLNKENYKDIEWLIKNPSMPKAESALSDLITKMYGSVFNGPHPAGYIHDGNYVPVQANFEFHLYDYDENKKDVYISNCKHFVENYIQHFKTTTRIESRWDKKYKPCDVIGFQVLSTASGLSYLGYEPIEGAWYYFTRVYGKDDTKEKFDNITDALNFAYEAANKEDSNDEDY